MPLKGEDAKARKREYDKIWRAKNKEKCKVYNRMDKRAARLRKEAPHQSMLADFLRAKTPAEKRKVIQNFAPYYFIFGNTLNPRNPYEGELNEQ